MGYETARYLLGVNINPALRARINTVLRKAKEENLPCLFRQDDGPAWAWEFKDGRIRDLNMVPVGPRQTLRPPGRADIPRCRRPSAVIE